MWNSKTYFSGAFAIVAVILFVAFSQVAHADPRSVADYELKPGKDFDGIFPSLSQPSIFVIHNLAGSIEIVPSPDSEMRFSGHFHGKKDPAILRFEEVEPGKIKIWIDYPEESAQRGRSFFGVRISRSVIVQRSIVVNGVETISGNSSASLRLELPSELFAHLSAETQQGDIRVRDFPTELPGAARRVELSTQQGDLVLSSLKASSGVKLKAQQGRVELSLVQGDVEVKTQQGDLVASKGQGDIRANSQMGGIRISGQIGHVTANTNMGNIELNNPESLSESATTRMGRVSGLKKRGCKDELGGPAQDLFNF